MTVLYTKEVWCRNCEHKQQYSHQFGLLITTTESIAVCKKCGFKSVWFEPAGLYDDIVDQLVSLKDSHDMSGRN